MARVVYPDPETIPVETRDRLERRGSLNVNRMMAHAPVVMEAYSRMGVAILRKGKLDPVLREMVILRIGQLCKSDYEWYQHVSVARAVGIAPAKLAAIESFNTGALDPLERTALQYAEETWRDQHVSDAVFHEVRRLLPIDQVVELSMVCGFYIMTAGFLKTFEIEIESTPPLGETMAAHLAPPQVDMPES